METNLHTKSKHPLGKMYQTNALQLTEFFLLIDLEFSTLDYDDTFPTPSKQSRNHLYKYHCT